MLDLNETFRVLTGYSDDNGNMICVGDRLKSKWGYEVIVIQDKDGDYLGKLVCDEDHPCKDIPYALNQGREYKIMTIENNVFTLNEKIIWDSGFGYDIGLFMGDSDEISYYTYEIKLITGAFKNRSICVSKSEIYPYTESLFVKMVDKYGAEEHFENED